MYILPTISASLAAELHTNAFLSGCEACLQPTHDTCITLQNKFLSVIHTHIWADHCFACLHADRRGLSSLREMLNGFHDVP